MPQFSWMTNKQIQQLHAYLRARARESLGTRKVSTPAAPSTKGTASQAAIKGPVTY